MEHSLFVSLIFFTSLHALAQGEQKKNNNNETNKEYSIPYL